MAPPIAPRSGVAPLFHHGPQVGPAPMGSYCPTGGAPMAQDAWGNRGCPIFLPTWSLLSFPASWPLVLKVIIYFCLAFLATNHQTPTPSTRITPRRPPPRQPLNLPPNNRRPQGPGGGGGQPAKRVPHRYSDQGTLPSHYTHSPAKGSEGTATTPTCSLPFYFLWPHGLHQCAGLHPRCTSRWSCPATKSRIPRTQVAI